VPYRVNGHVVEILAMGMVRRGEVPSGSIAHRVLPHLVRQL